MPYSLKITRNTITNQITVDPPRLCPSDTTARTFRPYKYTMQTRQIFRTREEAEQAFLAETFAAEYARLPAETLYRIFREDLDRVAFSGWSTLTLSKLGRINYHTLIAYTRQKMTPNPRTVARVHVIADALENVAKMARSCLPPEGAAGNPWMGRSGRKDIYKSSPNYRRSRGEI